MDSSEQDRQIVVESEHLSLVLRDLDEQARVVDDDDRLGLTLIELADVRSAAKALEDERVTCLQSVATPPMSSDLDRVLANLRMLSGQRYDGWTPTMGKNRTLTGVQFKPYANAGGFTTPSPATAPYGMQALPRAHRRVRVGLMDTRLEQHSALAGRYLADTDTLIRPGTRPAENRWWWEGHATFIAGIVLARSPAADLDVRTPLMPGDEPDSGWTMPVWQVAEHLAGYRDSGVSVLNLSLGCCTDDGKPPLVLERAIAQLSSRIAVVAAAGNHGVTMTEEDRKRTGLPERAAALFPAALDGVLAVGAIDRNGVPATFNPIGGQDGVAPWIDVFAPGVDVTSTYFGETGGEEVRVPGDGDGTETVGPFHGYATWSGTSFAAAYVTGAVAAMIAEGRTPLEAVESIRASQNPR
ncbi:MAG: S8 family peptidase [Pseudonocardia sp.]